MNKFLVFCILVFSSLARGELLDFSRGYNVHFYGAYFYSHELALSDLPNVIEFKESIGAPLLGINIFNNTIEGWKPGLGISYQMAYQFAQFNYSNNNATYQYGQLVEPAEISFMVIDLGMYLVRDYYYSFFKVNYPLSANISGGFFDDYSAVVSCVPQGENCALDPTYTPSALSARPGVTVGGGIPLSDRFRLEFFYRSINFENAVSKKIHLWGYGIDISYSLF